VVQRNKSFPELEGYGEEVQVPEGLSLACIVPLTGNPGMHILDVNFALIFARFPHTKRACLGVRKLIFLCPLSYLSRS
jgi:hypothetical protein